MRDSCIEIYLPFSKIARLPSAAKICFPNAFFISTLTISPSLLPTFTFLPFMINPPLQNTLEATALLKLYDFP